MNAVRLRPVREADLPIFFVYQRDPEALVSSGVTTFVEVGPGNVLSGLLKRIDRSVRTFSVNDLRSLDEAAEALA